MYDFVYVLSTDHTYTYLYFLSIHLHIFSLKKTIHMRSTMMDGIT